MEIVLKRHWARHLESYIRYPGYAHPHRHGRSTDDLALVYTVGFDLMPYRRLLTDMFITLRLFSEELNELL